MAGLGVGLAWADGVGGGEQGTFYTLGLPALLCAGDLPTRATLTHRATGKETAFGCGNRILSGLLRGKS